MKILKLISILISIGVSLQTSAREPSYCDPARFKETRLTSQELPKVASQLKRLAAFHLGKVTITGLAVGDADSRDTIQFERHFSSAGSAEKYCTYYVNAGNSGAEAAFHHQYVKNPDSMSQAQAVAEFMSKLSGFFHDGTENIVRCAEEFGYVAIGCNGMKHRGPTFFGMLLAYSGCTPTHASEIVNTLWGLNGIPEGTRLAIISAGYDFGRQNPNQSRRLQQAMME